MATTADVSSTLTQPGSQFIIQVSRQTGIDPRVLVAWAAVEGAYTKGGTGGYNYLNMKPFPGDKHAALSPKGFSQFANVQDAINATVTLLHAPQYANILATARLKPPPRQEIAAIAASPWDQSHYGGTGGPKLLGEFGDLFQKSGGASQYQSPQNAPALLATIGTSGGQDSIWATVKHVIDDMNAPFTPGSGIELPGVGQSGLDVAGNLLGPISSIGDAIKWAFGNWDRILLVIGGGIGLLVAIILIFKSQSGQNTFTISRGE